VIVVDDLDGIGNGGAASRRCQMQVSLWVMPHLH
jgi:hypothetical protein